MRSLLFYIDPGSGSFIFQVLIAGMLAAAVTMRASWRRIRGFFTTLLSRKS